jgi:glutathione S-transferase
MTQREVYFISGSPPCWSVILAMEIKELGYTRRRLGNTASEQKSDEFLAANPRGQVPVLTDGDVTVCETLAILSYLDAIVPTPPLFGETPVETARVWQIISECDGNLRGPVGEISRPIFRGKGAEFADRITSAAETARHELSLLEARLAATTWLAGEKLSAADLVVYPVLMQLLRAATREDGASLSLAIHPLDTHFPQLGAWAARIENLPGYDNAYPPHWR